MQQSERRRDQSDNVVHAELADADSAEFNREQSEIHSWCGNPATTNVPRQYFKCTTTRTYFAALAQNKQT